MPSSTACSENWNIRVLHTSLKESHNKMKPPWRHMFTASGTGCSEKRDSTTPANKARFSYHSPANPAVMTVHLYTEQNKISSFSFIGSYFYGSDGPHSIFSVRLSRAWEMIFPYCRQLGSAAGVWDLSKWLKTPCVSDGPCSYEDVQMRAGRECASGA